MVAVLHKDTAKIVIIETNKKKAPASGAISLFFPNISALKVNHASDNVWMFVCIKYYAFYVLCFGFEFFTSHMELS